MTTVRIINKQNEHSTFLYSYLEGDWRASDGYWRVSDGDWRESGGDWRVSDGD